MDIPFDFHLLANSHGVALLDGVTSWREQLRVNAAHDPRYGEPFQGWYGEVIPRQPIDVAIVRATSLMKSVRAWVIAGEGIGPLVTFEKHPGAAQLELTINPDFGQVLRTWIGTIPIVSMIQGNEHAVTMLNRWPPYDFLDPELPSVKATVPIIDGMFIDEYVAPWVGAVFYPLAAAKHIARNPMVHVLPPPPRENPQNSRHLETLREEIVQYGFAPGPLRLKWYKRYCRMLSAQLATIGCAVLPAPREACNQDGLLMEEYAEGLTHGNGKYGVLLASQIESWLSGVRP
jgi:hypothetical protein